MVALSACAVQPPITPVLQSVTPVPTIDRTNAQALCETALNNTDNNWLLKIEALETIFQNGTICQGEQQISERLYLAYVNYAESLVEVGRDREAQTAYRMALQYTAVDDRATVALEGFGELPVIDEVSVNLCSDDVVISSRDAVKPYEPSTGNFVELVDGELRLEGRPFRVHAVTYELLQDGQIEIDEYRQTLAQEMGLIKEAGVNTVRVFLVYEGLFQCPGSGAVPVKPSFDRLDAMLKIAVENQLRVILVLNHQADLVDYPLYENPYHVIAQTTYLVERYVGEPVILAWDVRDSGDVDYLQGEFTRDAVLRWLADTTQIIRRTDTAHLITAGWIEDATATAPIVDFVSFQHFGSVDDLRQRIAVMRTETDKPLFLAGVGYVLENGDEIGQRNKLYDALQAAENNDLLGWSVYTAFDRPQGVCSDGNCENPSGLVGRYGLWNVMYAPKLALDAVTTITKPE